MSSMSQLLGRAAGGLVVPWQRSGSNQLQQQYETPTLLVVLHLGCFSFICISTTVYKEWFLAIPRLLRPKTYLFGRSGPKRIPSVVRAGRSVLLHADH
jgi:hypothetical protein